MRAEEVFFKQSERAFMNEVIKYATLMKWRCYHTLRSDGSAAGFPDLVLVRARHPIPRIVYAELKSERNSLTEKQQEWLAELRACGAEAYWWRPSDFREIERVLR